jgi:hypothetical protein
MSYREALHGGPVTITHGAGGTSAADRMSIGLANGSEPGGLRYGNKASAAVESLGNANSEFQKFWRILSADKMSGCTPNHHPNGMDFHEPT